VILLRKKRSQCLLRRLILSKNQLRKIKTKLCFVGNQITHPHFYPMWEKALMKVAQWICLSLTKLYPTFISTWAWQIDNRENLLKRTLTKSSTSHYSNVMLPNHQRNLTTVAYSVLNHNKIKINLSNSTNNKWGRNLNMCIMQNQKDLRCLLLSISPLTSWWTAACQRNKWLGLSRSKS